MTVRMLPRQLVSYLIVGCGLFGLAIGSFLNVVIDRVPLHESIISALVRNVRRARRRSSNATNIPVLSWLILRGRTPNLSRSHLTPRTASWNSPVLGLFRAAARVRIQLGPSGAPGSRRRSPRIWCCASTSERNDLAEIDHDPRWRCCRITARSAAGATADGIASTPHRGAVCDRLVRVLLRSQLHPVRAFSVSATSVWRRSRVSGSDGWVSATSSSASSRRSSFRRHHRHRIHRGGRNMSKDQPIPYGVFLALGVAMAVYAGPECLSRSNDSPERD